MPVPELHGSSGCRYRLSHRHRPHLHGRRGAAARRPGRGHSSRVETRARSARRTRCTRRASIAAADAVILAADMHVDAARFAGKRVVPRQHRRGHPQRARPCSPGGRSGRRLRRCRSAPGAARPRPRRFGRAARPGVAAHRRHHLLPDRHRPHLHGRRGLEPAPRRWATRSRWRPRARWARRTRSPPQDIAAADAGGHRRRHPGRPRALRRQARLRDRHQGGHPATARRSFAQALAEAAAWARGQRRPVRGGDLGRGGAARRPSASGPGVYKHLMTGVSLHAALRGGGRPADRAGLRLRRHRRVRRRARGTLGWALFQIGAKAAFALMVPVLAGYIAFSIADRPGIAPGMIGGLLAARWAPASSAASSAGFIAGYAAALAQPAHPAAAHAGGPEAGADAAAARPRHRRPADDLRGRRAGRGRAWPRSPTGSRACRAAAPCVLGLMLGAMMAFDMGGPVNKAAYAFAAAPDRQRRLRRRWPPRWPRA